jgi:hypothetical protein
MIALVRHGLAEAVFALAFDDPTKEGPKVRVRREGRSTLVQLLEGFLNDVVDVSSELASQVPLSEGSQVHLVAVVDGLESGLVAVVACPVAVKQSLVSGFLRRCSLIPQSC